MRLLVLAVTLLSSACAERGAFIVSPPLPESGVKIARGVQAAVFEKCGGNSGNHKDNGNDITWKDDIVACWVSSENTIYAEDSCRGAKAAALHERAHEEGVQDPEKDGYEWK